MRGEEEGWGGPQNLILGQSVQKIHFFHSLPFKTVLNIAFTKKVNVYFALFVYIFFNNELLTK